MVKTQKGPLHSFSAAVPFVFVLYPAVLAASSDAIAEEVPAGVLGEALGWQGTMMMAGSALAPPLIGAMIDHNGWPSGFATSGLVGVLLCLVLIVAISVRRRGAQDVRSARSAR